jgi:hypothetical protein
MTEVDYFIHILPVKRNEERFEQWFELLGDRIVYLKETPEGDRDRSNDGSILTDSSFLSRHNSIYHEVQALHPKGRDLDLCQALDRLSREIKGRRSNILTASDLEQIQANLNALMTEFQMQGGPEVYKLLMPMIDEVYTDAQGPHIATVKVVVEGQNIKRIEAKNFGFIDPMGGPESFTWKPIYIVPPVEENENDSTGKQITIEPRIIRLVEEQRALIERVVEIQSEIRGVNDTMRRLRHKYFRSCMKCNKLIRE